MITNKDGTENAIGVQSSHINCVDDTRGYLQRYRPRAHEYVAMRIILSHGPSVLCGIQARRNSIVGLEQLIGKKTEEVEGDGPDRLFALQKL